MCYILDMGATIIEPKYFPSIRFPHTVHGALPKSVNKGLKYRWGICQPKRDQLILEMTKVGVKHHLPLVALPNADKMVAVMKAHFGQDPHMKWCEGGINQRWRVFIFHSDVIEASVTTVGVMGPILLAHEEKKQCRRKTRRT